MERGPTHTQRSRARTHRTLPLAALLAGCTGIIGEALPSGEPGAVDAAVDRPPDGATGLTPPGTEPPMRPVFPFERLSAWTYGTKIKNLMLGLPLTDAEFVRLRADEGALGEMVDGWMQQPAWRATLLAFFKQAFQQTQVNIGAYEALLAFTVLNLNNTPFVSMMEEAFPRTALALIDEGRPFTEVVTTRRFMMTPAMMSVLAYMDTTPVDDTGMAAVASGNWVAQRFPSLEVTGVSTPVPFEETIDPASPNFMHFQVHPRSMPFRQRSLTHAIQAAMNMMFGVGSAAPAVTPTDWSSWRMVTVRPPRSPAEPMNLYWDLPRLRTSSELVLRTPHVGFMTTPAFLANWPTNTSNQARVLANQTMIVALGASLDGRDVNVLVDSAGADAMHAQPGTACYACHRTLDPMRDFFRHTFTYAYGLRPDDASRAMIPPVASFSLLGSEPVAGNGVADLAAAVARHPRFAAAWTQRVCRWANSVSCDESDPEFQRVAAVFRDSGFNFRRLVRELFTSPLVTYAAPTQSARTNGVGISIARRDALCASLTNRLGLDQNVCTGSARLQNLAAAVPADAYARGDDVSQQPTDPDMFFTSGTENLCGFLAFTLVGATPQHRFSTARSDEALDAYVTTIMGVPPSDPRAPRLRAILAAHFNDAVTTMGLPRAEGLQTTFMLACSSPLAVAVGM